MENFDQHPYTQAAAEVAHEHFGDLNDPEAHKVFDELLEDLFAEAKANHPEDEGAAIHEFAQSLFEAIEIPAENREKIAAKMRAMLDKEPLSAVEESKEIRQAETNYKEQIGNTAEYNHMGGQ